MTSSTDASTADVTEGSGERTTAGTSVDAGVMDEPEPERAVPGSDDAGGTLEGGERAGATSEDSVRLQSHPTLTPTVIRLVGVVVLTGIAYVGLGMNPTILGDRQTTNVAKLVVLLLGFIGIVRLVVKAIILLRTQYLMTEDAIRREFDLLLRTESREVPYDLIRSHEFEQTRIQRLLGYGSVTVNQGLGTLVLEDIENPYETRDEVREQLRGVDDPRR